jgi:hypothetical protein
MSNESQVLEVSTAASVGKINGKASLVTSAGVAKFQAAQVHLAGDVWHYFTAGAPVDYTDGSPAATGEAEAGIGSLCTRLDTGKLYVNGGTKAEPLWKLVTSA